MSAAALLEPRASRLRLGRPEAFWAITALAVTFPAASSAPSPLYVVYQARWGFSATTLTVVFGIYAVALLGSLLVFGALSDHVGRRPVLLAAIAVELLCFGLFVAADGVGWLLVARAVQGLATGAAVSTLGAALIDLQPEHAPTRGGTVNGVAPLAGLAVGALGCGLLVEVGPSPTTLVWLILLGLVALSAVAVSAIPETSPRRPGARASLRPRVGVPARLRADVLTILPALLASWALAGLYMSLGPSVATTLHGLRSHLVGGLVVTLLCGTGALTAFLLRAEAPARILRIAASFLLAGTLVTLPGLQVESAWVCALGTAIAGVGFGASALGSFGTLARIAHPDERGELFAVAYVISYVTFSVPAVVAGLAATHYGLHPTAVVYAAVIAVVSLAALAASLRR